MDTQERSSTVRPGALTGVATALWAQAQGRVLAAEFAQARIPVLMLKGPELQLRLYGTPAAYPSSDVDVLVPRSRAGAARAMLERGGWRFEPGNGILWRLSRAATYARAGFRVDLHWGLHAGHLPSWALQRLETRMWAGATRSDSGFLEPDPPSLVAFLAVHAAGHRFAREAWAANVRAAEGLVDDRAEMWRVAREVGVAGALRAALSEHPDPDIAILDGLRGELLSRGSRLLRGGTLPQGARDMIRETLALSREGYGLLPLPGPSVRFCGRRFATARGVYPPHGISEGLVELTLAKLEGSEHPVVVDVGTGTGAVALSMAIRRPDAQILATDLSYRALACAWWNRMRLRAANVSLRHGDLTDPVPASRRLGVAAITANVPYVAPGLAATVEDWGAPMSAIAGPDADGLGLMRELARRARSVLESDGWLVFQIADWQWDRFAADLRLLGFEPESPTARRPGRAILGAARWNGGRR